MGAAVKPRPCESGGPHVSREVSWILGARVALGALGQCAARVLPDLPLVVPMKPELGQTCRNLTWLLLLELNPNPLADNLGEIEKARCLLLEQLNDALGAQLPIRPAAGEVDRW